MTRTLHNHSFRERDCDSAVWVGVLLRLVFHARCSGCLLLVEYQGIHTPHVPMRTLSSGRALSAVNARYAVARYQEICDALYKLRPSILEATSRNPSACSFSRQGSVTSSVSLPGFPVKSLVTAAALTPITGTDAPSPWLVLGTMIGLPTALWAYKVGFVSNEHFYVAVDTEMLSLVLNDGFVSAQDHLYGSVLVLVPNIYHLLTTYTLSLCRLSSSIFSLGEFNR